MRYGDVQKDLLVPIIQFQGQKYRVEVVVNLYLTHPLILRINWPNFQIMVQEMFVDRFCSSKGWCGICTALAGEAVVRSGTSALCQGDTEGGEDSTLTRFVGIPVGDFPLEQLGSKALRHAFNEVKVIDGQQIQPNVALSHPHFSVFKDRLY